MANKMMSIPNDDTKIYPFSNCILELLVETFEHTT